MTQIPDNAAAEASFDFVTDERFRDSLHSDYGELLKSLQNRAWKATHVLAGSVIEALLVDYLIFLDYKKRHGKDPLMFDLATAVDACRTEGVISERSAQLSTVVRGFRNLIHPGRVIRLEEKINQSTADVAKALVDIIVEEVAAARKTRYGLTAAQIIVKLEKDSTVLPILGHLLRETNEREKEHLALDLIPKKHLEHRDDTSYPLAALETCFHQLFEMLPDDARKLVARRFVTILKEQPDTDVLDYENAFFRAGQLKYLTDDEQGLVKKHLLSRIKGPKIPAHKLSAFAGIGEIYIICGGQVDIRSFVCGSSGA